MSRYPTHGSLRRHARREPTAESTSKGVFMATENEHSKATNPTKEEEHSSQRTGLIRRPQDRGIARRQQSSALGFPFTPYEMLSMAPFSLFRRLTEEFDRALQPFLSVDESASNIAWVPRGQVCD